MSDVETPSHQEHVFEVVAVAETFELVEGEERHTASLPGIKAYSAAEVVEPYWRWLRGIAREHPGLIFTIGYLFLASVGITYDYWLYKAFGIDVLDYAEAGDFLLAAVREPMVVLLGLASFMVIMGLQEGDFRLRRRFVWYRSLYRRATKLAQNVRVLRITLTSLAIWYFVALFTPFYAAFMARRIQEGAGVRVRVRTVRPSDSAGRTFALIGTTTRFLFVYDPETQVARILPYDNVEEITIVPRRPHSGSSTSSDPPTP